MKEKVISLIAKGNNVIKVISENEINNDLKIASYTFALSPSDFKHNSKKFKKYVDSMVVKFAEYVSSNKTNQGNLSNFKNKVLVNDLKDNGLLISVGEEIVGINILIKNKDVKIVTLLNKKDSEELLSIGEESLSVEEAKEMLERNKKLQEKIMDSTKISQIKPEKIIIELYSAI